MSYRKESKLARMRRWRTHSLIRVRVNTSARRVFGKPYGSHMTPSYKDYWIEVGDSPYGKKGTWKQEIPVGVYETGRLRQVASEVKASNPEIYTEGVYLRQVMKR